MNMTAIAIVAIIGVIASELQHQFGGVALSQIMQKPGLFS